VYLGVYRKTLPYPSLYPAGWFCKMDKRRVEKAIKLLDKGKSMAQVADQCHVHITTLRRWLRNYETYGDSLWTKYPEEVNRE